MQRAAKVFCGLILVFGIFGHVAFAGETVMMAPGVTVTEVDAWVQGTGQPCGTQPGIVFPAGMAPDGKTIYMPCGAPCAPGVTPCPQQAGGPGWEPRLPEWVTNEYFLEVATWHDVVDRVGILALPACPIAWKGDNPAHIYVWTGKDWMTITPRGGETMGGALSRSLYDIVVRANRSAVTWSPIDSAMLMSKCAEWRYEWAGVVQVGKP